MTLAAGVADLGFLHFQPQVGPFAGSLADARKHRVTAVRAGDAGDQLGQNDRLAQTGTAEQSGLAAADEGGQQVDHLDAGFEQFGLGRQIVERRGVAVDRPVVGRLDRPAAVDRIAHQVEHAAERGGTDRHLHRRAGVDAIHASHHAVGASQGHAAYAAAAELLLDFAHQVELDSLVLRADFDGVVNRRQVAFGKLDVEGRTDDLRHVTDFGRRGSRMLRDGCWIDRGHDGY